MLNMSVVRTGVISCIGILFITGKMAMADPLLPRGLAGGGGKTSGNSQAVQAEPNTPSALAGKGGLGRPGPVRPTDQVALEDTRVSEAQFYRVCRTMDSCMNIKGVERLARLRIWCVPNRYVAYAVLGYALEWQGQRDEASAAYAKAGQLLEADGQYRSLVLVNPERCAVLRKRVTGAFGAYFFADNDAEAQIIAARVKVRDNPRDPQTWFALGMLAAMQEDMVIVTLCVDQLNKLDPERGKNFEINVVEPTKNRVLMRLRANGLAN